MRPVRRTSHPDSIEGAGPACPPAGKAATIRRMDDAQQLLDELAGRVERLLAFNQRLIEQNAALKADLGEARAQRDGLQQRLDDARARVESALSRLPMFGTTDETAAAAPPSGH